MKMPSNWSEADFTRLQDMATAGKSAAEIGKAIGRTRSAVLGAAHRSGIKIGLTERPPRITTDFWTVERIEHLRFMVAAGDSGAAVARQLGCSRNAAVSKAWRLGLTIQDRAPSERAAKERRHAAQSLSAATIHARAAAPRMSIPPLREIVTLHKRPWLERRRGECCWPVDGEGADTWSCCSPIIIPGDTYCAGHAALAFQPHKSGRLRLYNPDERRVRRVG